MRNHIVSIDWEQLELRLYAVLANDKKMKRRLLRGEDVHSTTTEQIFGKVTKKYRDQVKQASYAIIYGGGSKAIMRQLDVPKSEAEFVLKSYHKANPMIAKYLQNMAQQMVYHGRTTYTLFGRARTILHGKDQSAVNSVIQGTAADMLKISIHRVYTYLKRQHIYHLALDKPSNDRLIIPVHDELLLSLYPDHHYIILGVSDILTDWPVFDVPMPVDVAWSPTSWGECEPWEVTKDEQKQYDMSKNLRPRSFWTKKLLEEFSVSTS